MSIGLTVIKTLYQIIKYTVKINTIIKFNKDPGNKIIVTAFNTILNVKYCNSMLFLHE